MFAEHEQLPVTVCGEGQERRISAAAGGLMVCELRFAAGAGGGPLHSHPHRQVSYAVSGRFAYTVEGETRILRPGDSVMVEPGLPHGCVCLEAGVLLDIFTPEREEFLA